MTRNEIRENAKYLALDNKLYEFVQKLVKDNWYEKIDANLATVTFFNYNFNDFDEVIEELGLGEDISILMKCLYHTANIANHYKAINLTLTEFVFLDGNSPKGDTLEGRTLVLHVRTATVLEFLHNEVLLKDYITSHNFSYLNRFKIIEEITCAVLFSPLIEDREIIMNETIYPAIRWYVEYLKWEDNNIEQDNKSILN